MIKKIYKKRSRPESFPRGIFFCCRIREGKDRGENRRGKRGKELSGSNARECFAERNQGARQARASGAALRWKQTYIPWQGTGEIKEKGWDQSRDSGETGSTQELPAYPRGAAKTRPRPGP